MRDLINRLRRWLRRLFVVIRRKLREIENKLDEHQPHPVVGGVLVVAGIVVAVAGVAMLVLPGPGMIAIALGVALVIVGAKVIGGKYGPERKSRERREKKERLRKRRAERESREAEETGTEDVDGDYGNEEQTTLSAADSDQDQNLSDTETTNR